MKFVLVAAALCALCCCTHVSKTFGEPADEGEKGLKDLDYLFEEDFEESTAEDWQTTDPSAWRVVEQKKNHVYELQKVADYKPKVRSPFSYALIPDATVTDFVFRVKARSTTRDYHHRDLCFFFGYQDPEHFYYAHLGKKADPHSNSIFIVDATPRVSIATETSPGTDWDEEFHEICIKRDTKSGTIEVYFDDMEDPCMKAEDTTFLWGRVGIGSFDDTGQFDDVRLWGELHERDVQ